MSEQSPSKNNRFHNSREALIRVAALLGQANGSGLQLFPSFPRPVLAHQLQVKTGAAGRMCWAGKQASKIGWVRGIMDHAECHSCRPLTSEGV